MEKTTAKDVQVGNTVAYGRNGFHMLVLSATPMDEDMIKLVLKTDDNGRLEWGIPAVTELWVV